MSNKEKNQEAKKQEAKNQQTVKPGNIKGKIHVDDTRERRDGPGGN